MNPDHLKHEFKAWLEKPENRQEIKKLGGSIHRKMTGSRLFLRGVDPRCIQAEEVGQELTIFLLQDETALNDLIHGGPRGLARLRHFLWHRMIDLSRQAEGNQDIHKDTWRLFYRHVLDVLSRSDLFVKTRKPGGGALFGRTEEEPLTLVLTEDLLDIEYPGDMPLVLEQINTAKNILQLALYFWEAAAALARDPHVRIDISTFLAWIEKAVPVGAAGTDFFPPDGDGRDNPLLSQAGKTPMDMMKQNYLSAWAGNFFNRLREIEKKIFFYYECRGLTHQEVSFLLDRKGTLSYRRDKIRDMLKSFLRPLEWLSPDDPGGDPDQEGFVFFMERLCRMLGTALQEEL